VITQVKVEHVAYNPEVRRKSYLKNKERATQYSTEYNRTRRTGITPQQYLNKLNEQNGVCAICSKECTRALAIDHNHTTGQLRGLLCNKCNRGIGYLNDDVNLVQKAMEYLKRYDKSQDTEVVAEYKPRESNWGSDWVDDGV
jgi:hypothetical protein